MELSAAFAKEASTPEEIDGHEPGCGGVDRTEAAKKCACRWQGGSSRTTKLTCREERGMHHVGGRRGSFFAHTESFFSPFGNEREETPKLSWVGPYEVSMKGKESSRSTIASFSDVSSRPSDHGNRIDRWKVPPRTHGVLDRHNSTFLPGASSITRPEHGRRSMGAASAGKDEGVRRCGAKAKRCPGTPSKSRGSLGSKRRRTGAKNCTVCWTKPTCESSI